jgi:putative tryptophan/tyrosine transport system substrate-binding protein
MGFPQKDPVGLGTVRTLARPDGNITGFASYDVSMIGEWSELLKEIAPRITHVAIIFNPQTAHAREGLLFSREVNAAARSLGPTVRLAPVHDKDGIATAIAAEAPAPGGGLICLPDSLMRYIAKRQIRWRAGNRRSSVLRHDQQRTSSLHCVACVQSQILTIG